MKLLDAIEVASQTESNHTVSIVRPRPCVSCDRCGRKGHISKNCYASTHEKGGSVDMQQNPIIVDTNSPPGIVLQTEQVVEPTINNQSIPVREVSATRPSSFYDAKSMSNGSTTHPLCSRCGRRGHVAANCFAKTNVIGDPI